MSIRYLNEPELTLPDMICAWPGIAQVSQIVAATLRNQLGGTRFAELDPKSLYHSRRISIDPKVLENVESAICHFYVSHDQGRDVILFIGQSQPPEEDALYTETHPTYRLANLVLDVAERFHCRRIYLSGAAVAPIHHTMPSHVWAVPNDPSLVDDMSLQDNVVLMSMMADGDSRGFISGFNGHLLDSGRQRGMEAICLMGEVPYYLQGMTQSYPAAAHAVLQVVSHLLDLPLNLAGVKQLEKRAVLDIEKRLLSQLSNKGMADLEHQFKALNQPHGHTLGPITDKEQRDILQHIEDMFVADDGRRRRLV